MNGTMQPRFWEELKERLAEYLAALQSGFTRSPRQCQAVLADRAAHLCRPPEVAEAEMPLDVVEFRLGQEPYAIEVGYAQEILLLADYTPLPLTPPFVLGIANVRGKVLSILDLREIFGIPARGLGELNKIIVLQSAEMSFGILADAISGFRRIDLAAMQRPGHVSQSSKQTYIRGILQDGTIVLDGAKLLSDKELIVGWVE